MSLNYVFGYRCFDGVTNTAKFLSDGRVVFVQAGLGVILDSENNEQVFFKGHTDDVVSMAVHPSSKLIATGQRASKRSSKAIDCHVWEVDSLKSVANNNGFHKREINKVAFSPNGVHLLSVGRDDDNSCCIYNWK